jgi:hypothetical protein
MKIELTPAELDAVLWAIGMQTTGNANDIDEMMACGMTRPMCRALIKAESKLIDSLNQKHLLALAKRKVVA